MAGSDRDTILSSDSEGPGSILPPPRIAARFSRSTTSAARRKSSAASSRRNSMSSHHSNKTALSAHGGPFSTHIAQHLRRASLLESRKARLAEKAAHAEKVRLRAAMAKAAPRINANSEERALAAKQARERYLAQVAANCHEEVKRAKRVAEDAREKKAAEHLRMKGEMEGRLAEAEKRRVLFQQSQRRSKNTGVAAADGRRAVTSAWKPRSDLEATKFLQRAWRNRQRRKIVAEFVSLGLNNEAAKAASFDEVGALLNHESVLTSTSRILRFYGVQEEVPSFPSDKGGVRTFLSAFLIVGHPHQVLDEEGVQEHDLVVKADTLLGAFETLLTTPLPHPGFSAMYPQLVSFLEAYTSFQSAFSAWKNSDASILVNTMVAQFVELDAIWQSVKDDRAGGVADDYKAGVQQNQTLILVRLKRMLGSEEAVILLKKATNEARRARGQTKRTRPSKASRPRSNSSTDIIRNSTQLHPDSTTVVQESRRRNQPMTLNKASPSLPDNRTIVHELALNREYRIDDKPRIDMKEQIIQAMSENVREGLASGLGDIFMVAMSQTIRDKLLSLIPAGKPLYGLISETLDPTLIENQVKTGAFSYQRFFSFISSVLPQLCAPVRDPDAKALAQDQDENPIERLAKTIYVIDLLSLDHANFSLQINAPMLLAEGIGYEKRHFQEEFTDQPPPRMRAWWQDAAARCKEELNRRAGEAIRDSSYRVTPERIYMQGLVDLAVAVHPLEASELPESLELDRERIVRIRSDVLRIITIEAILLTAKNLLKRDVRNQWKTEAQRMWQSAYDDPQAFSSAIPHALPPNTKTVLTGTINSVLADARMCRATHTVTKVLLQKMKSHILNRLTAASADERIMATTTATEKLASCGLSEFISQVGELCGELKKVADVDRAAHGDWYNLVNAQICA